MSNKRDAEKAGLDKPRQKKYHKRAAWACDECRLRKIKCDGSEPCKHCLEIAHDCSYAGRTRPTLPPTKRIRLLEDTLRQVRATLVAAKDSESGCLDIREINSLLDTLDPSGHGQGSDRDATQTPQSHRHGSTETPTGLATNGAGAWRSPVSDLHPDPHPSTSESLPAFFGPISIPSIVNRASGIFQYGPSRQSRSEDLQRSLADLLCATGRYEFEVMHSTATVSLPSASELVDLHRCCFDEHLLVFPAFSESELTADLRLLDEDRLSSSGIALLHVVAALGHTRGRARHTESTCQRSLEQAWHHFLTAERRLNVTKCEGIRSLQAVLCMILFLVGVSDITTAHTYSAISCGWIFQLGLHKANAFIGAHSGVPGRDGRELLVVTLKLHLLLTSTLDVPLSLQRSQIDPEIWALVQSRNEPHLVSGMQRSTPAICHFLLLELTKEGLDKTFTRSAEDGSLFRAAAHEDINLSQLGSVEARLQELIERVSVSASDIRDVAMAKIAKGEAEMTTYLCQLMLYLPIMHHVTSMANGSSTSRTRSQRVLTCIKVASKTIAFYDAQLKHDLLEPSSWFQSYTLFLAILTLVFLIAAHRGTTKPSEAWKKAEHGIRVLAAMRCHDNGAAKCLKVLRALVSHLSHTVEFDLDAIERTTPTLCEGTARAGESARSSSALNGGSSGNPSPAAAVPAGSRDRRMEVSNVVLHQHQQHQQHHQHQHQHQHQQQQEQREGSAADRMLREADSFVLFGSADPFDTG